MLVKFVILELYFKKSSCWNTNVFLFLWLVDRIMAEENEFLTDLVNNLRLSKIASNHTRWTV